MLNIIKELNMRVGKECYAKTNKYGDYLESDDEC